MFKKHTNDGLARYGSLVLRVGLSAVLLAHALSKPILFTFPGTISFFEQHGFPGWTVYPVFTAELTGGVLLAVGLFTRWAAVVLVPVTAGAVLAHADKGWLFTNPGGGWEFPAFLSVALLAQALLGPGTHALDNLCRTAMK